MPVVRHHRCRVCFKVLFLKRGWNSVGTGLERGWNSRETGPFETQSIENTSFSVPNAYSFIRHSRSDHIPHRHMPMAQSHALYAWRKNCSTWQCKLRCRTRRGTARRICRQTRSRYTVSKSTFTHCVSTHQIRKKQCRLFTKATFILRPHLAPSQPARSRFRAGCQPFPASQPAQSVAGARRAGAPHENRKSP